MRVDDRDRPRQLPRRQVVIGHDHLHPQLARLLDFGHVGDAAVAGDHQAGTGGFQALEAPDRQAVPLGQARRDMAQRLDPQRPQGQHPDHHRGHAVGVVIAPDRDPLSTVNGALDAIQGNVGIGHQRDVVQRRLPGVQEAAELLVVAESAPRQQRRHRGPEADEGRRLQNGLRQEPLEARQDHPAMVVAPAYRRRIGPLPATGASDRRGVPCEPWRARSPSVSHPTRTRLPAAGWR